MCWKLINFNIFKFKFIFIHKIVNWLLLLIFNQFLIQPIFLILRLLKSIRIIFIKLAIKYNAFATTYPKRKVIITFNNKFLLDQRYLFKLYQNHFCIIKQYLWTGYLRYRGSRKHRANGHLNLTRLKHFLNLF